MASDDAQLITALTKRLKTSGSKYDPVEAHVAVAVGLARGDPSVATGTVCKSAGIPKGRFHKQIDEWRKRIVAENLLVECSRAAVGGGTDGEPTDAAATAHSAADSIDSSSPNAIAYDNDAARDKERLARRARAERERYAAAKAVRETLESIVARIERQAERDTYAQLCGWRCPAGCKADCARARFRQQCVPSREEIETHLRENWLAAHPEPAHPGVDASRGRYEHYNEQHANWSAGKPSFELSGADVEDVQLDFLAFWDGYSDPTHWLYLRLQNGAAPERELLAAGTDCVVVYGEGGHGASQRQAGRCAARARGRGEPPRTGAGCTESEDRRCDAELNGMIPGLGEEYGDG